ncbi:MAG: hypothetical protein SGARI_005336 [Bacillariaceae sp.]
MPRPPKPGSTDLDDSSDIPEKQTAKFFSIQLPAIPSSTDQAIRATLKKENMEVLTKESTRMINHISQLQHEEKHAQHKVKVTKERLAHALVAKTDVIDELRQSHEGETKRALDNLEKTMRKDQEKEYQKMRERIKAQVKIEYEQKFEEERDKKRKREEEEMDQGKEEQEEGEEQEEEDKSAKRQKLEHAGDDEAMKDDGGDGAPPAKAKLEETIKVEELEKKRGEVQEKMEKLSEKKSEMFWLLKQVIMQETKQKMMMQKKS